MADALAISAAVVQFLDIAIKLTLQLSSLYKEVRDVPEKLQRLKVDLDQQIAIAKYVQSSHASFWNGPPAASAISMSLDQPLADYVAAMEQLVDAVRAIMKPEAGTVRRGWNVLRATQKCKEAIKLCDALERKKSNIIAWLSTANMEISAGIKSILKGLETKVDLNLQLAQNLERAYMQPAQQLSQIPALLDLSRNTHSAITELSHDISSSQQRQLVIAANTDTHVRTLVEKWQELSPTFHEFRDIVQQSLRLQQSICQVALNAEGPFEQVNGNGTQEDVNPAPIIHRRHVCTCREIIRTTGSESLSFLHLRKVFRQTHHRNCPKLRPSATSMEYLIKVVPPTWLLSQTINISFCIHSWNSRSSWKISPLVIGGARLVDSAKSPAFQAIRNVRQLNSTGSILRPEQIKDLEHTLQVLLKSNQASVFDEDHLGSTLLYGVLDLYLYRSIPFGEHDPCAEEFLCLIQYLLELGSDPNVHRRANSPSGRLALGMVAQNLGGTLLDIFATSLVCQYAVSPISFMTRPVVYEKLVESDAHFSRPLTASTIKNTTPVSRFVVFNREIEQINVDGQHEVCNLTDLMIAVIQHNEPDFNKALAKDNIHEASLANGLAAIHFAIHWPWALQELINAGADVDCEDNLGRRPIHLATGCGQEEAVDILLKADCSLFTPNYSCSLLQESLKQGRAFDHTTTQIIHALIDRHGRLLNLAFSVLPNSLDIRNQFTQRSFAEGEAPKLIDALMKLNCHVPASLEVDRVRKCVYDTAAFHADVQLTPSLADQLWDGGFHRVDEPAILNSLTPILHSWYVANLDMVAWFISKGASPFSQSPEKSHSGLHLCAARMADPLTQFESISSNPTSHEALLRQLTSDASMWHDSCRCLCSPGGCTPISVAFKQMPSYQRFNYETTLELSKSLHEKLLYQPENEPAHIQQLLSVLVFEKLNFWHSCCHIGKLGQTKTWDPWQLEGKRDSCGLEAEYHRTLTEYSSKMLRCGCDTAEKPVCVVFRDECEKRL